MDFPYNDRGSWPAACDGRSQSLPARSFPQPTIPPTGRRARISADPGRDNGLAAPAGGVEDRFPVVSTSALRGLGVTSSSLQSKQPVVDISGYFITNDANDLDLFQIPGGSVIAAAGSWPSRKVSSGFRSPSRRNRGDTLLHISS